MVGAKNSDSVLLYICGTCISSQKMKLVWSFLLSIVATLCVGSAHGVSDISYVITLNKESTADELASLTAAFPVSAITTFTLVNLEVMSVVAEPEAAAAGEATTSVSMMSDAQAVIAYEISDVVVYEEESIRQSALAAVNLTTAQVTVVVNATFVIEGVVVVPLGYSATDLRADLATDIGVPIERVTVVEVSASTRRKLSQLSESTYAYTITSNDFTDATAVKTAMSSPTALGTVGSKLGTVVQNTSAVPKISARVKTIFSSIAETTMKEMFEEKLSFISTAELTRRVNIKLKEIGIWTHIPKFSYSNIGTTLLPFTGGVSGSNRFLPSATEDPPTMYQNWYFWNYAVETPFTKIGSITGTVLQTIKITDQDGDASRGYSLSWDRQICYRQRKWHASNASILQTQTHQNHQSRLDCRMVRQVK
jgi:hypothetical protein